MINIQKSNYVIHHINRIKKKNHMISSIDAQKAFDKILHQFMIKMPSKLGIKENFLNLMKNLCKKPAANIIFNGEKLNAFPLRLEQSKDVSSHQFYSTSCWKSQLVQQDKKKKKKVYRLVRKKRNSLFVADMIVHVENPSVLTLKTPGTIQQL